MGPWCVKIGAKDEVGYCTTKVSCEGQRLNCKRTQLGTEYRGDKSTTQSGRKCAPWYTRMSNLDPTITNAKNYCRNPDGDIRGPWCYVDANEDKQGEAWESCGIEWCDNFRYG